MSPWFFVAVALYLCGMLLFWCLTVAAEEAGASGLFSDGKLKGIVILIYWPLLTVAVAVLWLLPPDGKKKE